LRDSIDVLQGDRIALLWRKLRNVTDLQLNTINRVADFLLNWLVHAHDVKVLRQLGPGLRHLQYICLLQLLLGLLIILLNLLELQILLFKLMLLKLLLLKLLELQKLG